MTAFSPMMLLSAPFDPGRTRRVEPLSRSGALAAGAVLAALAAGLAMQVADGMPGAIGRAIARGGAHGAFLVGGWIVAARGSDSLAPVLHVTTILFAASLASVFTAWGALLYLLGPVLLLAGGVRHDALRSLGVFWMCRVRSLVLGLAAGAFLGGHVLVSASLTAGYLVRVPSVGQYLGAVAYDVGASALTAEWLFRGALFSRWWRQWEFWPAAGLSTALAVFRYVADPALPPSIEVRAGAIFYTALLGFTACALRADSGSLLPGYVAGVTFFAAYRMLVP